MPSRVVSLVPSLTESVAATAPELLAGATDWCTEPAGLNVPRVGGSKYPRIDDVLALAPDLVLGNREENRRADVEALRAAGIEVWVCFPRTVAAALSTLDEMMTVLGVPRPGWLDAADAAWSAARPVHPGRARVAVVPVWRRPWIWLGADTFAADVLRRLGVEVPQLGADPTQRYPRLDVPDAVGPAAPDLVVLPDEPYRFTAVDGPEAFGELPAALVSGRHLTWYGPSLAEAPGVLGEALSRA
ncbi:ABC transporter substrate-binding protein [Actinocatenispora thailandica]|uniref:ABC transporter substrate-binding protein n=1 Tax=Actinocatenispora thailandica TaxID=227318 RepID=A0A7R7DR57_9ACTN|nr:helical backbone metal receptor [Actinocatenispora thailandica]BCJ36166.1 ABC transporter substrate-binding protein [Actinocatenispora thailandica]